MLSPAATVQALFAAPAAELLDPQGPAACAFDLWGERGLLLIGNSPDLGPYVLPGNNYHVYDIPLFWENLRLDVARRMRTWAAQHR